MKYLVPIGLALAWLSAAKARGEDIGALVRNAGRDHPRLILKSNQDVALRKKTEADPLLRRASALVKGLADDLQRTEPVKREKVGQRLLPVSRTCLKRVLHLALAYRLTGDQRHAHRAQREMLAAAAFSDWNPSHFLDVAEMTAALAIGYDWLYAVLEPTARATIKRAIVDKGLRPSLQKARWQQMTNNWNQVCHGGLALGALAVMEDEPDLALRIIERALARVPISMADYAPDGAYAEGPAYWRYGSTYNVLLISALESALGSDLGLLKASPFLASSDYFLHVAGPTGLFFNYSDSGLRSGVTPIMYWFAAKRREPSLLWRERLELKRFLEQQQRTGLKTKPRTPRRRVKITLPGRLRGARPARRAVARILPV
ncbi:MAG: hypothetical protein MJD61_07325, partial [Proteobacteria bacterium]|nr:hypothetical protein [Pseudomonadota bacterium]